MGSLLVKGNKMITESTKAIKVEKSGDWSGSKPLTTEREHIKMVFDEIIRCYDAMCKHEVPIPIFRIPKIEKVIYNGPATIIWWKDNTKTVVKCHKDDIYDPEKGLAMAICKKALGNGNKWHDTFKKYEVETNEIILKQKMIIKQHHN